MLTPEFWILVSFVCFVIIFGKKVYLAIVSKVDGYSEEVNRKIQEAEKLKEEASCMLQKAHKKQSEQQKIIKDMEEKFHNRIQKLSVDHEKHMKYLAEQFESSFNIKIKAEMSKKIDELTADIAASIAKELEKKILQSKPKIKVSIEDLKKL